jgi:hypothetical protein
VRVFFFNLYGGTLGTAATTGLLVISDGDCGEIGAMKVGRGTEVLGENLPLAPLCPPQMPHD